MPLPTIPPLTLQLVEALDKRFPDRCARPEMTEREIWIEAGARKVIALLYETLRRQEQDRKITTHVR